MVTTQTTTQTRTIGESGNAIGDRGEHRRAERAVRHVIRMDRRVEAAERLHTVAHMAIPLLYRPVQLIDPILQLQQEQSPLLQLSHQS